jgi:hypothetical protein
VKRFPSAFAFVAAFVWAWLATGPRLLVNVNWDASVYLAHCSAGTLRLGMPPWNAHYAVSHIYVVAAALAKLVGKSCIDGFRLADALAFAAAAAIVCEAARRLSDSVAVALGATALWATGFALSFELFTLEDNILFFAPAAVTLWLAAARFTTWGPRDSIYAGIAAAVAALISWQAILYLGPVGYAALFGTGRSGRERRRDLAILVAAFCATALVYCAILYAATPLSLHQVFTARASGILRRPAGNFDLRLPVGAQALRDLGAGVVYTFWHAGYDLPAHRPNLVAAGLALLAVEALLLVAATRLARRQRVWAPHVLAVTALAFTLATPAYRDLPFRYLLRLDYLPLVAALGIAATVGALPALRRWSLAVAGVLVALAALQLWAGLRWDRTWLVGHRSWYRLVTDLRTYNPACVYVFSVDELKESNWNFEIPALLSTELPRIVAVGDDVTPKRWRFPLPAALPTREMRAQIPPCAWISLDAQRVMSMPYWK